MVAEGEKPLVEFNVSHAGAWTVIAAEQILHGMSAPDLGVDIMPTTDRRIDSLEAFFRLMRRQFTDREWERIDMAGEDADRVATFYRLWTLKESYVKAIGTGLTVDLKSIEFRLGKWPERGGAPICDTKVKLNGVESRAWVFEESQLDNHHCVSVARRCLDQTETSLPPAWDMKTVAELLPGPEDLLRPENLEDWHLFSAKTKVKPF